MDAVACLCGTLAIGAIVIVVTHICACTVLCALAVSRAVAGCGAVQANPTCRRGVASGWCNWAEFMAVIVGNALVVPEVERHTVPGSTLQS
ncbi:MAG: hypothetical protein BWX66_01789 [Deltaproteobacteria bacterium ADurb.Bin058]|nr:MAG: hypothetical protein BWX66_01789 [Deltaproteobacteria bacterium ADurb.Bin058]